MKPINTNDHELLIDSLQNESLVFLDGFHAIKHALRFNADIQLIVCTHPQKLDNLIADYAPDVESAILAKCKIARTNVVDALRRTRSHWTGVYGVAIRPEYELNKILNAPGNIVLLENPYNLGNLGACIRTAAAAQAAGVILINGVSPWEPPAIRGAAGLQFAVPVVSTKLDDLLRTSRKIIALDPQGSPISQFDFTDDLIFAFGTEREGLSDELKRLSTITLGLPMQAGVSSMNLATSVGIVLYAAVL